MLWALVGGKYLSDFIFESKYRDLYKSRPLEDIIIFRSGPMPKSYIKGMDFSDNARALFEYALSVGLNHKFKLVWIVKNPDEYQCSYSMYENVNFFSWEDADTTDLKKRDNFFYHLCLAKYLFMTDSYGFALGSRKDQIRVMLWHGCGFKDRLGHLPNENNYEYMTVTGEEYAKTYSRIFGLRSDQMLVTGYPKVDYIFHPLENWMTRLNLKPANKYIFWLPTFRNTDAPGLEKHNHTKPKGETGLPVIETIGDMEKINDLLYINDSVMIIKLHPMQDRKLICDITRFSNIVLVENEDLLKVDIQINQILGYADALISDYSSVAVDYLVLDRPVGFTLDDLESYQKERGFFWDDIIPHLPGKEIYDFNELYHFIADVLAGKDPGVIKRYSICTSMQKYRDDHNSERVLKSVGIEV